MAGSFFAALVFWLSIRLSDTYTHVEVIDLAYALPVGSTFAQDPPGAIEAAVTATGWDLLREQFRRGNRSILIDSFDLRQNPDGVIELRRELSEAFGSADLAVESIANPRVVVRTEAIATKAVPLRLRQSVAYAIGYSAAGAPALAVDSVFITGPRSQVMRIDEWFTDSLVLRNLQDSTTARVTIARDRGGAFEVEPRSTLVRIGVQEYTERSLDVPVRVEGYAGPDSVRLFPATARVTSAVGLADYEQMSPADYTLVVNFDSNQGHAVRELPIVIKAVAPYAVTTTVEPRSVEAFVVRRVPTKLPQDD